jgi:hypothetical protein
VKSTSNTTANARVFAIPIYTAGHITLEG